MKKTSLLLVLSVLLLIVCSSLPAFEHRIIGRSIIYVDDDNTEGPWDGTIEHPYQHIQDGIDNASVGDTVFVFNGTYFENVIVDKSVDLVGEDKNSTLIDGGGSGHVVFVSANGVNMSGFTVQHCGSDTYDAGIYGTTNHSRFNDNIIKHNQGDGIRLEFSSNICVEGNIITDNYYTSIILQDSFNNTISSNNLAGGCVGGIYLRFSSNNILSENNIENTCTGIYIRFSPDNNITCNTITKSSLGMEILNLSNNIIAGTKIKDNEWGIRLTSSSNNNIVSENMISNSNHTGIYLIGSINNIISDNTLNNNSHFGCYVKSSNNIFYHNVFINNEKNAWDCCINTWDDGYPSGGNYWSDYAGKDEFSGPNQTDPGSDGIGDTPYDIPGEDNQDRYPLGFFDEESPLVAIAKPKPRYIYFINYEIMPFLVTLIFVNIDIEVNAHDNNSGIDWVEIYIDDVLKANDTSAPYSWSWEERTPGKFRYTIKAIAYDKAGNHASNEMKVWKFF